MSNYFKGVPKGNKQEDYQNGRAEYISERLMDIVSNNLSNDVDDEISKTDNKIGYYGDLYYKAMSSAAPFLVASESVNDIVGEIQGDYASVSDLSLWQRTWGKDRKERTELILKAREELKKGIAKDVVCTTMIRDICKAQGVESDFNYYQCLFDRKKYDVMVDFYGCANSFEQTVAFLKSNEVTPEEKAEFLKNRVNSLIAEAGKMVRDKKDKEGYGTEYESLSDKLFAMRGLEKLAELATDLGIELDDTTINRAKSTAEFAKSFKKTIDAKMMRATDPVLAVMTSEAAKTFYQEQLESGDKKSFAFVDGEITAKEEEQALAKACLKVLLMERGLDPEKSVFMLSDQEKPILFNEINVGAQAEPLIVFDENGKFKSYVEFDKDGNTIDYTDVKTVDLQFERAGAYDNFRKVMQDFYKRFDENDVFYKRSSQEYKDIYQGLYELSNDSLKMNANVNPKEKMTEILNKCLKYEENAEKKGDNLSEYAKNRLKAVQDLRRTIQTSITSNNVSKYVDRIKKEQALKEQELKALNENKEKEVLLNGNDNKNEIKLNDSVENNNLNIENKNNINNINNLENKNVIKNIKNEENEGIILNINNDENLIKKDEENVMKENFEINEGDGKEKIEESKLVQNNLKQFFFEQNKQHKPDDINNNVIQKEEINKEGIQNNQQRGFH